MADTGRTIDGTAAATDAEAIEVTELEEQAIRKRARANAVDDGDASHSEGAGAAGSAPDFGQPKNYSGIDKNGL